MIQIQGEDIVFIVAPLYHVLDPIFLPSFLAEKALNLCAKSLVTMCQNPLKCLKKVMFLKQKFKYEKSLVSLAKL